MRMTQRPLAPASFGVTSADGGGDEVDELGPLQYNFCAQSEPCPKCGWREPLGHMIVQRMRSGFHQFPPTYLKLFGSFDISSVCGSSPALLHIHRSRVSRHTSAPVSPRPQYSFSKLSQGRNRLPLHFATQRCTLRLLAARAAVFCDG